MPLRFSLVQKHTVEFNQLAMANSEGSEAMLNRVMTKDNIGVAVLLELRKEMMEMSCESNPMLPAEKAFSVLVGIFFIFNFILSIINLSAGIDAGTDIGADFPLELILLIPSSWKVFSWNGKAAPLGGQRPHALGPRILRRQAGPDHDVHV